MSSHVLLNVINKVEKRDKNLRVVVHFIAFFCNDYHKFNNTGA